MTHFFQFESDFVDSLRCIPMIVRFKLDSCGVKLKLNHWNQFSQDERLQLVTQPCDTASEQQAYRTLIHQQVATHGGDRPTDLPIDTQPAWIDTTTLPDSVQAKAAELNLPLTPVAWAQLTPLQRFALIKLSRSNHENLNFLPALQEFGLFQSAESGLSQSKE